MEEPVMCADIASAGSTAATSVPVGTIVSYVGTERRVADLQQAGWLVCDGHAVPAHTYLQLFETIGELFGSEQANFFLPDLRGMFLRGADLGSGTDPDAATRSPPKSLRDGKPGPALGSQQADMFRSHKHEIHPWVPDGFAMSDEGEEWSPPHSTAPTLTGAVGGSETRPVNVYVVWLIYAGPAAG
jgi:hypothetical protein